MGTQQDPHPPWFLTGLSAREPRQSTVGGSRCSGTVATCSAVAMEGDAAQAARAARLPASPALCSAAEMSPKWFIASSWLLPGAAFHSCVKNAATHVQRARPGLKV